MSKAWVFLLPPLVFGAAFHLRAKRTGAHVIWEEIHSCLDPKALPFPSHPLPPRGLRNPNLLPFNIGTHFRDLRIFDVIGFTRIHMMLGLEAPLPPREEKIHRGNKHNSRVAAIRPEGLRPGWVFLPGIRWPWNSTSIPTAPHQQGRTGSPGEPSRQRAFQQRSRETGLLAGVGVEKE